VRPKVLIYKDFWLSVGVESNLNNKKGMIFLMRRNDPYPNRNDYIDRSYPKVNPS
jgi:hypothetical protein